MDANIKADILEDVAIALDGLAERLNGLGDDVEPITRLIVRAEDACNELLAAMGRA